MDQYFAECVELGLDPLEEAGGLRSWVKRFVTGSDHGLVAQLNVEVMHRVKTAEDKKKLLDEIDDYIAEGKFNNGDALHAGRASVSGAAGHAFRGRVDNRQYIENLKKVRARVAAVKTKD
jgi:hypothetical protein